MIEAFIRQYYEKQPFIPREILVPLALENLTLLETWLKNLKGGYVRVHHPVRGEKRRLMDMALENAEKELQARIESGRAAYERLERLQRRLQMETRPARIECFDNSHIMGNYPVAGMVVFAEGKPDKEAYRKFTIQTVQEPDDYAYMAEIMQRRFGKDGESEPFPDLLMVDGGKGQLNIARAVVDSLGLTGAFQLIGIAKKDERKGETADKFFCRAVPIPSISEKTPICCCFCSTFGMRRIALRSVFIAGAAIRERFNPGWMPSPVSADSAKKRC
jgi:excinuclease ABC subunit C